MGVLPALIGMAWAALPVIEESVTRLKPVPLVDLSFERFTVVALPPPARPPEHALYRLRVAAPRIWLDGSALKPNADGDFDLLNLPPRRVSRVTIPDWPADALLMVTPRVFISQHEIKLGPGGRASASLTVRNSLENTVNIYVTLGGAGGAQDQLSADATVPPGYTQMVKLDGVLLQPGPPWRLMLEKQEEAMEGAYQFLKIVDAASPSPVNSYVKP